MTYDSEPVSLLPGTLSGHVREYGEETAREIDCAVRALVEQAFERASGVLTERRPVLEAGARRLLEQETLAADELCALLSSGGG